MLAVSLGAGVKRPQGRHLNLVSPPGPIAGVHAVLAQDRETIEGWWSPNVWEGDYRKAENWRSGAGIAIDVDYRHNTDPTPEHVRQLQAAELPGSLWHLTPHGARIVFVFAEQCTDRDAFLTAALGAGELVKRVLPPDYQVDEPILQDLGRLFYLPNTTAKGKKRSAAIVDLRVEPYTALELGQYLPKPEPESVKPSTATKPQRGTWQHGITIAEAIEQWNADHPEDYPRDSAKCPVCGAAGSFGHLPGEERRWHCFSTHHPSDVGVRGARGYHGDALDLDCFRRGLSKVEVLRDDGYLPPPRRQQVPQAEPPPRDDSDAPPRDDAPPATPIDEMRRPWRSRSYLTAVSILEQNARDVLGGLKLEWDEMAGRPTLGRKPLADVDVSRIRSEIERRFTGGRDAQGNETGLVLASSDVYDAAMQVASAQPFHPVREYLGGLQWDGVERIGRLCEEVLNVEAMPLNVTLVRMFLISAVARAVDPGCQVHTVLVLVGPQGCGKSTLLRTLAGPWHCDTAIDIHSKDSYLTLRRAWILEWAELESLQRARDAGAVKAFITSSVDRYRPPYGRLEVDVPRSGIITGSTNNVEFLADETGARRFWPLTVGEINVELLAQWRDQLWAEALAAHAAGERWHLEAVAAQALVEAQQQYQVGDAWDDVVLPWAAQRIAPFTTADILLGAIKKPEGQWTRADEMRVARIMTRAGWCRFKAHRGGRIWKR